MFGKSRPVVIDYGHRRKSRRVPRWLVLLGLGIALGAGGLWLAQERYLPPRLSPAESLRLRHAFEQADAQRAQLQLQLEHLLLCRKDIHDQLHQSFDSQQL